MEPLVNARAVDCRTDRKRMWLALADTHRLAHALGASPLSFAPLSDAGSARFLVSARVAGFALTYEEHPFVWREYRHISIRRVMRSGPAREYRLSWELKDSADGGCRVELELAVTPASVVVWPFLRVQARRTADHIARLVGRLDANVQAGREPFDGQDSPRIHRAALERALAVLEDSVGEARRDLVRRLADYVVAAPDIDAGRIRPYALARRWGADRRAVLAVCLLGVKAGLLDLSWEVVCPSCRVGAREVTSLTQLEGEVHCQFCDLTSSTDLDRSIEVTVRPAASVRSFAGAPYCISGPFLMPHVVEQAVLPGGGSVVLHAPPEEGRYRLFVRGGAVATVMVGEGGASHTELFAGKRLEPSDVRLAAGGEIQVTDGLDAARHVKLEHLAWGRDAATAFDVSTLPEFRRLFASEALRPGRLLSVKRATFVFTDLCGSTELYDEVGDAAAYSFIQEHFDLLARVVERSGGAVVKTLGDSIMAVFPDDLTGIASAVAMQREYQDFAMIDERGARMGLKVGVYAGPCFAVQANGILDYFGQTVNTAQRLETVAAAGDIVVPAELARAWAAAGPPADARAGEELRATLKGMREPLDLVRIRVGGSPA